MNKVYILLFSLSVFLLSCERDITIDLPAADSKYVVDGYVETGLPPYVLLSRNAGYFDPLDSSSLNNSAVSRATVVIFDGFVTDTLTEIDTTINGLQVRGIYVADPLKMLGVEGRTYQLRIITEDGTTMSAQTKLQPHVALDSVWFKIQEDKDSLGFVWANLKDPDTLGNCYRWFAKRFTKDDYFIAPFGSAFEDKFINGRDFDFAYNRGSIQNSVAEDDLNEEEGFFKKGDTIVVKFCAIDQATFTFWRDADNQISNNGSPFAIPSNIKSNIVNGRGLFASYAPAYDTIYVAP